MVLHNHVGVPAHGYDDNYCLILIIGSKRVDKLYFPRLPLCAVFFVANPIV